MTQDNRVDLDKHISQIFTGIVIALITFFSLTLSVSFLAIAGIVYGIEWLVNRG